MRRRALLAASQPSGGGAPEFPLYLYFDYCEEEFWGKTCVREADEIGARYFEYLRDLLIAHGILKGDYLTFEELNLDSLGIEIYIDDEKVTSAWLDINFNISVEITTDTYSGTWTYNGKITMDS